MKTLNGIIQRFACLGFNHNIRVLLLFLLFVLCLNTAACRHSDACVKTSGGGSKRVDGTVLLSSLELSKALVAGEVQPTADMTIDGNSLSINGKAYERGVCVNGYAVIYVQLAGGSESFSAVLGVDDESSVTSQSEGQRNSQRGGRGRARAATMSVKLLADDGRVLYENNEISSGDDGVEIEVDTTGVELFVIVVNSSSGGRRRGGGSGSTHYDLADAKFAVSGAKPKTIEVSGIAREVLTPKPGPAPQINGPELTGVSPGRPVLIKIPVTGDHPITYVVDNLPAGLSLDASTGIIRGEIKENGTYNVTLRAKNSVGEASRPFKIVAEGTLALTPMLGWNSWNARGRSVTDDLVRRTADAFVSKGLIDHGWTYICIDDGWERSPKESDDLYEGPTRDEDGNYIMNRKFPDMKGLGDYIHEKGLKYGIYSSPGPTTCQGLEASYGNEANDVAQWCSWGVDYLKYDWCSYRAEEEGLAGQKKPYQLMRSVLDDAPRDIIYSICQYGNSNVWEWGNDADIRGNTWRCTRDIRDSWVQTRDIGFNPRWTEIDLGQYGGPGHWNDVDMLVVGVVGWSYEPLHETKLTPAEQYTHISLWCMHAAPLILGCHLDQADDFTIGLLTNDEVLAVNQDPMGRGGKAVYTSEDGNLQVWSRPLADGGKAVGLFNLDEMPRKVTARASDIDVTGQQVVRDLWRQKDLGIFGDSFSAEVPRHGCLLLKFTSAGD